MVFHISQKDNGFVESVQYRLIVPSLASYALMKVAHLSKRLKGNGLIYCVPCGSQKQVLAIQYTWNQLTV